MGRDEGLDPQVQLQFAIDPIDPLVVPTMAVHVAKVQKTQPEPASLAGARQPDQKIGDVLVLDRQLRGIAIASLADPEGPAGHG